MSSGDNRSAIGGWSARPYLEIPVDLSEALAVDDRARATFEMMSDTHRREWVRWIAEAKKDDTRAHRIAKAVASLNAGTARR